MAGGRNPGIRMLSARITGRSAVRTTRLASDNWNSGSPAVFPGTGKWMRIFAVPVPFVRRFWVSAEKSLTFANEPNLPAMKIRGFFALLWAGLLAAVAAAAEQPVAELYDKAEYRIAMRDSVALRCCL